MFTKAQLLHLDRLKPNSVFEMDTLLRTLEVSAVFFINKVMCENSYELTDIYCNRKSINNQRDLLPEMNRFIDDPEMYNVTTSMVNFIGELINSYHMVKLSSPGKQLNVEISVLTRHSVSISYDLF